MALSYAQISSSQPARVGRVLTLKQVSEAELLVDGWRAVTGAALPASEVGGYGGSAAVLIHCYVDRGTHLPIYQSASTTVVTTTSIHQRKIILIGDGWPFGRSYIGWFCVIEEAYVWLKLGTTAPQCQSLHGQVAVVGKHSAWSSSITSNWRYQTSNFFWQQA
jgi:hypothetical protein